MHVFASKMDL